MLFVVSVINEVKHQSLTEDYVFWALFAFVVINSRITNNFVDLKNLDFFFNSTQRCES